MSKSNTIKEIAKKIANNGDANDYRHIPIKAKNEFINLSSYINDTKSLSVEVKNVTIIVK